MTLPSPKRYPLYGSLPAAVVPITDGRSALLPAPPSVNEAYRNSTKWEIDRGHRGRRKTDTYRSWIKSAGLMLNASRLGNFASPVAVTIRVGKCNQAKDLDNHCKCLLDLLVHCGVIRTDNLTTVHRVTCVRAFGDVPEGMVSLSVEFMNGEAA